MADVDFAPRMSQAESLMWRLEKDPVLSSNVANVTIVDRPIDVDRFLRRMERAQVAIPRLRQKVQPVPGGLTPPLWVDDPDFDLAFHIRHIALPAPGSVRQLLDLGVLMATEAFDRNRPLWEYVVVDGVEGGKGALIQKMHHTLGDGEAGMRLSLQFLDRERDAPEPPALEPPPPATAPPADRFDGLRDLLVGSFRLPLSMARQAMELAAQPGRIPQAGAAMLGSVKGLVTTLGDTTKARSPLWTERSLRRHLEVLRAPLDPTKAAAKAMGGTLNSAFLTAAAAAAGAYHREMGTPVETLRASMAVSTRTTGSGTNAFSLARMDVPTGEMPIAERLAAITAATQHARQSSAGASMDLLAAVAASLPVSIVARIARAETQTIDFATSNVRGAPMPLYIAGSRILENYPIGPLAGVAFNLTLLSYNGSLDMGLHVDPAAITEPELLTRLMEDAFAELRDGV